MAITDDNVLNTIRYLEKTYGGWVYFDHIVEYMGYSMMDEKAVDKIDARLKGLCKSGRIKESEFVSMGSGYSEYEEHCHGEPCYRAL